ncbi:thioredoxin family protein [Hymenobacter canadensis]|uniref:Thioredoxin family protein n=1 Tax=Hymenobacter canadensis TaxID=2999067 RepID=A0ABY7LQL8_9BACT|nr:thioredoxin family protein [Hymenobacter canadensis]WBA42723.1 thioredoxin family protein [Hymenobacter canadensis]
MKVAERQRVHDVSDEQLRQLTHEHLKVFAKFTSENCDVCEQLAPPFVKFSDDEEFETILFVRLNSDENPVAKKIMQEKIAPFFVSYCQGRLLECDMLTTEAAVLGMLQRLKEFMPQTS